MGYVHLTRKNAAGESIVYVYESVSYWDKDLKQPRAHRKLIGKLDPETGELIPNGKPGRKKSSTPASAETGPDSQNTQGQDGADDLKKLYEDTVLESKKKDLEILTLKKKLQDTEKELEIANQKLKQIAALL